MQPIPSFRELEAREGLETCGRPDDGVFLNRRDYIAHPEEDEAEIEEASDEEEEEDPLFELVDVPGDGSCLFHCLKIIIKDLYPRLRVSVGTLRGIVAGHTTEEEFVTSKAVYEAAVKEGNTALLPEVSHLDDVQSLEELKIVKLTPEFWGNDACIRCLSKMFNVTVLVLHKDYAGNTAIANPCEQSDDTSPTIYALLALINQHYHVCKIKGDYVFNEETYERLKQHSKIF